MAVFGTLAAMHPTDRCASVSLTGAGAPSAELVSTEGIDGLGGAVWALAPDSTYLDETSGSVYVFGTDSAWHEI